MTVTAPVRYSKAEAEAAAERGELARPSLHAAWDEDLQRFLSLGEKIALDTARRAEDPDLMVADFQRRRELLLKLVANHLTEAEYDDRGNPKHGKLNDYYLPAGADHWCLTKAGASKAADFFKYRRAQSPTKHLTETPEYVSATVHCDLVDAWRNSVGAYEAAASTAEPGFQHPEIRQKYGAIGAWDDGAWKESKGPDYRAALNDIVARAGKRAFVGALIVAIAAEEIFEIGGVFDDRRRDEDDDRLKRSKLPSAKQATAPRSQATRERNLRQRVFINNVPLSMYSDVELLRFLAVAIERPAEAKPREVEALREEIAFRMKESAA